MNRISLLCKRPFIWLARFRHRCGYGVHSPFAFHLITGVIYEKTPYYKYAALQEEEKRLDYRSKKEVEGALRLVEIPGYDLCACCAPHVKRTGEIGLLKVMGKIFYYICRRKRKQYQTYAKGYEKIT